MGTWKMPYDQKNAELIQPRSVLVSANSLMTPLSASAEEMLVRSTNEIITPSASSPRTIQRLVAALGAVLPVSILVSFCPPWSTRRRDVPRVIGARAGRSLGERAPPATT